MSSTVRTVSELAAHVDGHAFGDGNVVIHRVASLETAGEGEIAYVEDEKFFPAASSSNASCVIAPEGADVKARCRIEVKKPKLAFALVAEVLHPSKQRAPEIHPSSVIAPSATVGDRVFIGAFVCIGENSSVGDGTQIRAGAKIGDNVRLGKDCVIHPNVFLEDGVIIGDRVILHARKYLRRSCRARSYAHWTRHEDRQHGARRSQLRYRRAGRDRRSDGHQRQRHNRR